MSKIAAATVRDLIIDIIRALAIIFMIIWHSLMWFSNTHCYHEGVCSFAQTLLWQGVYYIGSLWSVPLFYFSAGMALAVNLNRGKIARIWQRSLGLFLFGYLFTGFIMGLNQILHAWVLQSIAAGLLITLLFQSWGRSGIGILLLLAFCVSILNIGHPVLTPDWALSTGLLDYVRKGFDALLINGAFPVFPWIGFIALGVIWQSATKRSRYRLLGLAVLMLTSPFFLPVNKYPLSPGYLLLFSALCVLLTDIVMLISPWFERHRSRSVQAFQHSVTLLSSYSLEIFVIHYVFGHLVSAYFPYLKLPIIYSILPGFGLLMLSLIGLARWIRLQESLTAME